MIDKGWVKVNISKELYFRNYFPPVNTFLTRSWKLFKGEVFKEIQFFLNVDLDPTFIYQVTMFFKKLLTDNVDENKLLLSKQTNATQLKFCASQLMMYCATKTKVARSRSFEF